MGNQSASDRITPDHKEVYMPLKLKAFGHVISHASVLNISCDGTGIIAKMEMIFKTVDEKTVVDHLLEGKPVTVEIGDPGEDLHLEAPAVVKWHTYSYGEGEKIYDVGLNLKVKGEAKKIWREFCQKL